MGQWSGGLLTFSQSLSSLEGIIAAKERFTTGWAAVPKTLVDDLKVTREKVTARPDKSATGEATGFLVVAQERLNNVRIARRNAEEKKKNASLWENQRTRPTAMSLKLPCSRFTTMSKKIFGAYYRLINHDDEGEFKAKFEPTDGKLGLLDCSFHKKGMFPPGAYHSEGHQDGMGVCLYLALMKRVLGERTLQFAVLDDVVMSVDSQHRKQFCKLLEDKGSKYAVRYYHP